MTRSEMKIRRTLWFAAVVATFFVGFHRRATAQELPQGQPPAGAPAPTAPGPAAGSTSDATAAGAPAPPQPRQEPASQPAPAAPTPRPEPAGSQPRPAQAGPPIRTPRLPAPVATRAPVRSQPTRVRKQRRIPSWRMGFGFSFQPVEVQLRISRVVAFSISGGLVPIFSEDWGGIWQSAGLGFSFYVKGGNLQGLALAVRFAEGLFYEFTEEFGVMVLAPQLTLGYTWVFGDTFLALEGGITYPYIRLLGPSSDDSYSGSRGYFLGFPLPLLSLRGGFYR